MMCFGDKVMQGDEKIARVRTSELDGLFRGNTDHDGWQTLVKALQAFASISFADYVHNTIVLALGIVLQSRLNRIERKGDATTDDSCNRSRHQLLAQSLSSALLLRGLLGRLYIHKAPKNHNHTTKTCVRGCSTFKKRYQCFGASKSPFFAVFWTQCHRRATFLPDTLKAVQWLSF